MGYYGGNPEAVKDAPVSIVIGCLHFEVFENEIQKAYIEKMEDGQ